MSSVALLHKVHRLRWQERLADQAEEQGNNTVAASEIVERRAKDPLGYWERNHAVRHGGMTGGQVEQ